ncbi:ribosomal protein S18-alanine N-acetyltransferase [Gammaproteobacteria bacterium]|nr:ribosomal protein S18-alanine N-acetyltransferase [Gammaproteobacteria bacterium]
MDRRSLRRMEMEDLESVLRNERKAYRFPWTEGIFKSCLCNGDECWIILDKKILGHAVLSFAAREAHLLNLCIHPDHQNQGLGKQILDHVLRIAKKKGALSIFLEVRVSNAAAVYLYENAGFNEIGRRAGYYPDEVNREDAIVLGKELL